MTLNPTRVQCLRERLGERGNSPLYTGYYLIMTGVLKNVGHAPPYMLSVIPLLRAERASVCHLGAQEM